MCQDLCAGTQLSSFPLQNSEVIKPEEEVSVPLADPFTVLHYSVSESVVNTSTKAAALLSTISLFFSLS